MGKIQPNGLKSTIRGLEGFIEISALAVLYYFVWRHQYGSDLFPAFMFKGKYVLAGVYVLLLTVLFFYVDGFKFGYLKLTDVLISQCIALFITNFITYWQLCLIANAMVSPLPMLLLMALDAVVALICTYAYTKAYHQVYVPKNMVMIFGQDDAVTLKLKMDTRPDKYHITRLISVEEGLERIFAQITEYDAVIINDVPAEIRNDILKFCYQHKLRTYVAPKISDIVLRGATDITLFDTPLLLVRGQGLTTMQRFAKRTLDIALCLPAMVVAAPVMLAVAIAIKIEDGGPALFVQDRVTMDNKPFKILKFRSMIVDAEKDGTPQLAQDHDPRITRVGRFIRATRLDELPQLLNILKGDMSIVGPRPERQVYIDRFCKKTPEFAYRLKVKSGLTGYAQIYGKYNTSPYDKLRLDLMYIEDYSLMLDIKLILMTIRIMLKKDSTQGFSRPEEQARLKKKLLREAEAEREEALPGGRK